MKIDIKKEELTLNNQLFLHVSRHQILSLARLPITPQAREKLYFSFAMQR